MIKQTVLGKYLNSPPRETRFYNTDDFDGFCTDYSSIIDNMYNGPLKVVAKPTIMFDEDCMTIYYPDIEMTVVYSLEKQTV